MPVLDLNDFGTAQENVSAVQIKPDTLAYANNNPGNLRFVGQRGAVEGEGGFARFESPGAGFDALKRQIALDAGRGHTMESFVNKFAPPTENDTSAYVKFLQESGGFDPKAKVSDLDQEALARAMAQFESGSTVGSTIEPSGQEVGPSESAVSGQGLNLADFSGTTRPTGEPVEQPSQLNPLAHGEPEKGSELYDYLYGSLVELPRDLVWGAVTWPLAQLVRHSAVAGQKIQQQLGLVSKMTPEEQAALGENAANWIQTLGGLATPKTKTAQASEELAGKFIEPINKLAHWTAQGVNPEKHPNLHNVLATGVEFGIFATIPKVGKKLNKIAKDRIEMVKKTGKAKQEAAIKIAEEQAKLLEEIEANIDKKEFKDLIAERREKNQQLIAGAEGFSAIDLPTREGIAKPGPTKSELSQRSRGFEETVGQRPNLGAEPTSGLATEVSAKTPESVVAEVNAELPGNAVKFDGVFDRTAIGKGPLYQITPQEGPLKGRTFSVEELSTEAIKEKLAPERIKLVEDIPGEKKVYQILLDTLRNEKGYIRIPTRLSKTKELVSPELRDRVREVGRQAEGAGMSVKDFLKSKGMDKESVRKFDKLYEQTKIENPTRAGLETPKKAPNDFNFFREAPGETRTNLGKDANPKIIVDTKDANILFSSPEGRKGLASYFKPSEFMFDRYPGLRPLLSQAREIQAVISKDLKIAAKHLQEVEKRFPKKKLREEAGAAWHNLSESGRSAMEQMGVKVKDDPAYAGLKTELQPLFNDLFTKVNAARSRIGKRPIPFQEDYLSFFAKEGLLQDMKNLIKGKAGDIERTNLILDDLATIQQRQAQPIKDSVAFRHLKRTGLREGVELDLDPLAIYSRYLNDSLRHIHMSPLNAFIKELLTKELTDPQTGKSAIFKNVNPTAASEIGSWNNKLAGLSNLPLPPTFERIANKGMQNLTVAQLFGNARTSAIQTVALFPTAVKHGYFNTAKGIAETIVRGKKAPIEKSSALETAIMDAAVNDMARVIAGTKRQKAVSAITEIAAKLIKWPDYLAREATFRTVWNQLEPLVRKGKLTEKEAIRMADAEVIRTQGSGDPVELSPIQRNVIGKMATLWQTFTINHLNFIAKDVLGIKNPEANPKTTAARVLRYVGGMVALNALFEQFGGIQSPLPAPEQTLYNGLKNGDADAALLFKTLLEVSEAFPFGGSIKFGSNPVGPLVEHANDIAKAVAGSSDYNQDLLDTAVNGKTEKARIRARTALAEIVGKTLGVPGTAQAAKYVRGRARGESVPRSIFGRIGKPTQKSKRSSGRRRRTSRRRRR